MPAQGQRIGEYILDDRIGKGGFGEVWRARHHIWKNQVVAVKIPSDTEFIRQLQREGVAVHDLRHPGIVRSLNFDPFADPAYLVLEYVPGVNLRELIRRRSLSPNDAIAILRQLLVALTEAHGKGVTHGDIKPENVLIHEDALSKGFAQGMVKLTDFGLARRELGEESMVFSGSFDTRGALSGTHRYVAPEQLTGELPGHQADLFACGIILFEMLTGEWPAGTEVPSDLVANTPKRLDEVFRRGYARKNRRYMSASEFLADLDAMSIESASVNRPRSRIKLHDKVIQKSSATAGRLETGEQIRAEPFADVREDFALVSAAYRREGTTDPVMRRLAPTRLAVWQLAADRRSVDGAFLLADCLAMGVCVEKDEPRAAALFSWAAGQGHLLSIVELGWMSARGKGVTKNSAEALRLFMSAAEGREALGALALGIAYKEGMAGAQDPAEAMKWFRLAVESGCSTGLVELGRMYKNGMGAPRDPLTAVRLIRRSAEYGNLPGMFELARMFKDGTGVARSATEAVEWFRRAADGGYALAMNELGYMYCVGSGVACDPAEAVRWFREAADRGNTNAMNNLGAMYEKGAGVPRSPAEAVRWVRQAAAGGDSAAMSNLGCMYHSGRGVPQDGTAAMNWFLKAAELGNSEAMKNIAKMYERGSLVQQDLRESVRWHKAAAERGDADAIGILTDRGVPFGPSIGVNSRPSVEPQINAASNDSLVARLSRMLRGREPG